MSTAEQAACEHDWDQYVRWFRTCRRCHLVEWRHLRWFKRWAYWSEKRTWI